MDETEAENKIDKNIEDKISRKIAEAKLDISEKRLHFVIVVAGAVLTIFGVIMPLWLSNRTSDKIDGEVTKMKQDIAVASSRVRDDSKVTSESLEKAIYSIRTDLRADLEGQSRNVNSANTRVDAAVRDMQNNFKELAGVQLRKPVLQCLLDGFDLQGRIISFFPNPDPNMMLPRMKTDAILQIKNIGDAPAQNLQLEFYSTFDCEQGDFMSSWRRISDEPTYSCSTSTMLPVLDPKQSAIVSIPPMGNSVKLGEYPTLLKIFYKQLEPSRHPFTISISGKK